MFPSPTSTPTRTGAGTVWRCRNGHGAGDPTNVTFEFGEVEKTRLTVSSGGDGILIPVVLTPADLATVGTFRFECRATVYGPLHTLAVGTITVSPEPTEA